MCSSNRCVTGKMAFNGEGPKETRRILSGLEHGSFDKK